MPEEPAPWPRPRYETPGGKPFVFYVVYGEFHSFPRLDPDNYRTLGVHPGLELSRYVREEHSEYLQGFEVGYLWDKLVAQDAALARRVSESSECLILRGELDDRSDLDYLRDSVGLLAYLLDHGGVCVHDPQMFRWWEPEEWRRQLFEPSGPVPRRHVVVLTSTEETSETESDAGTWFHTRGLRKFGRPDLSVRHVPSHHHEAVLDLIERFVEFQAYGGVIAEGQEIRMNGLPSGMTCHHAGDMDDPDFNNVHVEITPPVCA
jgi:hypothetical protein